MRAPLHRSGSIALWALASGALAAGAAVILEDREWSIAVRVGLAAAPVVVMAIYGLLVGRAILQLDELEIRVYLEGSLIGGMVAALGLMFLGLLTMGRVLPPLPLSRLWPWLWIGWTMAWAGGVWWAGRRYE